MLILLKVLIKGLDWARMLLANSTAGVIRWDLTMTDDIARPTPLDPSAEAHWLERQYRLRHI